MRLYIGTSGYQYKFWRGHFYSERCKEADMLSEYGAQLGSVEVNNTFYRMPKSEVVARWAAQVPDDFRFAIKASQRITHKLRLKECEEPLGYLKSSLQQLGDKLGVVLFQLPPFLKADVPRLSTFLSVVPEGMPVAMEFRHESWNCDATYEALRARGAALCLADVDDNNTEAPWVHTAPFAYVRLRREEYSEADLQAFADRLLAQPLEAAFIYFKHEEPAAQLAQRLSRICAERKGA